MVGVAVRGTFAGGAVPTCSRARNGIGVHAGSGCGKGTPIPGAALLAPIPVGDTVKDVLVLRKTLCFIDMPRLPDVATRTLSCGCVYDRGGA